MPIENLTAARLREILDYDPNTGAFSWRPRAAKDFPQDCAPSTPQSLAEMWNKKFAGKPALNYLSKRGYLVGTVKPRTIAAHRAAWAHFHGAWPSAQIDHINGDRTDNRIENLRCVENAINAKNMARSSRNTSGVTGVFWAAHVGKWTAQIWNDGKARHLGLFDSFAEAVAVRKRAERDAGYHANHGRAS